MFTNNTLDTPLYNSAHFIFIPFSWY